MNSLKAFKLLVRFNLRESYPNTWALGGALVALLLSLMIYWFTTQTFEASLQAPLGNLGMSYFVFVVLGECALIIPLALMDCFSLAMRDSLSFNCTYQYLSLPQKPERPWILLGFSKLPQEVIRLLLTLAIALLFFPFVVPYGNFYGVLLIQILAIPAFLGMGLIASSILVVFGRGEKFMTFGVNLLSIFSGLYFPLSVLPTSLQSVLKLASPFYLVLESTRGVMINGWQHPIFWEQIAALGVWGFVFLPMGFLLFKQSLNFSMRRGSLALLKF